MQSNFILKVVKKYWRALGWWMTWSDPSFLSNADCSQIDLKIVPKILHHKPISWEIGVCTEKCNDIKLYHPHMQFKYNFIDSGHLNTI